jgi:hypothetical protein
MYIQAARHYITEPFTDPRSLQDELKKLTEFHLRRTNKFIMLSLLGAHACLHDRRYPPDLSVYFATENGNLNDTEIVLGQIYRDRSFPKPINFINTMSNVAAFYIAQSLDIAGRNIMVSARRLSFERALELARTEFVTGTASSALVGAVDESVFSREVFEKNSACRFGSAPGRGQRVDAPVGAAQTAPCQIEAVRSFAHGDAARQWCAEQNVSRARIAFGLSLTDDEKSRWKDMLPGCDEYRYIDELGYNDSITACGLASFVNSPSGGSLLHVNRDDRGCHALVLLRTL